MSVQVLETIVTLEEAARCKTKTAEKMSDIIRNLREVVFFCDLTEHIHRFFFVLPSLRGPIGDGDDESKYLAISTVMAGFARSSPHVLVTRENIHS